MPPRLSPVAPGAKVTWLELLYDLVFAYAFIRVSLTAAFGPASLLRVLFLVCLLWFLWITFTALGNFVRGDEGPMQLATLVSVGVTFVVALVLPFSFVPRPHPVDFVFAVGYPVVRGLQVWVYWERVRQDPRLRPRWLALAGEPAVGAVLLVAAAAVPHFVDGYAFVAQAVLLGLAVALAYGVSVPFGFRELERISARHWVDRYAQIILIALGESILALGTARTPAEVQSQSWLLLISQALGLTIISTIAFSYFDTRMIAGQYALREATGRAQTALARDAYVYLHLPMILGILAFSHGLNEVRTHIGTTARDGHPSLEAVFLLYGGLVAFYVALLGFQRRTGQRVTHFEIGSRPVLLLLAIPAVAPLPALYALVVLAVFSVVTTVLNVARNASRRIRIRAAARAWEFAVAKAVHANRRAVEAVALGAKVTWLELFYDLVFVYAFVRVTLTSPTDMASLVRALLLVALLWYLWVTFTTLGNILRGAEGLMLFATLTGAGATYIAARVVPFAFGPRLHREDYIFATCYIVVRATQTLVIWLRFRHEPPVRTRWPGLIAPPIIGSVLLLAAAALPHFISGHVAAIRLGLLASAVLVAYGISVFVGMGAVERISPRHWADRFGQIMLIALGESIISLGTSRQLSQALPPTLAVIGTAALGITTIIVMAIAYFDTRRLAGEHALRQAEGSEQTNLARDAYVLLHLPMILGILLFSLGLRNILSEVANPAVANTVPAGPLNAALLYGGLFVYFVGLIGFQFRIGRPVHMFELISRPPLLLLIPVVALLPAILTLGLVTAFLASTATFKFITSAQTRGQVRAATRSVERAEEAAEAREHAEEEAQAEQHVRERDHP
jgi:low temperature requirement protein LtrA